MTAALGRWDSRFGVIVGGTALPPRQIGLGHRLRVLPVALLALIVIPYGSFAAEDDLESCLAGKQQLEGYLQQIVEQRNACQKALEGGEDAPSSQPGATECPDEGQMLEACRKAADAATLQLEETKRQLQAEQERSRVLAEKLAEARAGSDTADRYKALWNQGRDIAGRLAVAALWPGPVDDCVEPLAFQMVERDSRAVLLISGEVLNASDLERVVASTVDLLDRDSIVMEVKQTGPFDCAPAVGPEHVLLIDNRRTVVAVFKEDIPQEVALPSFEDCASLGPQLAEVPRPGSLPLRFWVQDAGYLGICQPASGKWRVRTDGVSTTTAMVLMPRDAMTAPARVTLDSVLAKDQSKSADNGDSAPSLRSPLDAAPAVKLPWVVTMSSPNDLTFREFIRCEPGIHALTVRPNIRRQLYLVRSTDIGQESGMTGFVPLPVASPETAIDLLRFRIYLPQIELSRYCRLGADVASAEQMTPPISMPLRSDEPYVYISLTDRGSGSADGQRNQHRLQDFEVRIYSNAGRDELIAHYAGPAEPGRDCGPRWVHDPNEEGEQNYALLVPAEDDCGS